MPTSRSSKTRVVITMGDPSGIGPEVALKSLASSRIRGLANFLLIGDKFVIDRLRQDLGLTLKVPLLDLANVEPKAFSYGKSQIAFARASLEYIDKAVELLMAGQADCLVTAPVNKSSIRTAGFSDFQGHTEYLAHKTGASDFAMMFVGKDLKVVPVTRHIALSDVPRRLSMDSIYKTIAITHDYLKKFFRIMSPRIGVCGLNPHAGEGGSFGDEEARLISPAVKKASSRLGGIFGPLPSDVIFYDALNKKFDAVVAMYHDQGLGPFKMLYFKDGVNLTLGLPFIRTSPDHGTAFNISGKGTADPASMTEAILLACRLSKRVSRPKEMRCLPKVN